MPEGPELHLTMLSINKICKGLTFSGKIARNQIHKCADVDWDQPAYWISATSRGKEIMLHLQAANKCDTPSATKLAKKHLKKTTSILFTFGMSGKFAFTPVHGLLKHSHLTFFTNGDPKMALSFVDPRRFGKWIEGGQWSTDRGPCIIQEYNSFVNNIVVNLDSADFNKPICEVMLNQKYFSGIGNYLRAEILFRCQVPPFVKANSVLQLKDGVKSLTTHSQSSGHDIEGKSKTKSGLKQERGNNVVELRNVNASIDCGQPIGSLVKDEAFPELHKGRQSAFEMLTTQAQELLKLCHVVPLEVVHLGSSKYTLFDEGAGDGQSFEAWLQCYNKPGMSSLADHNKRTMWFNGPAGPLVPKDQKSRIIQKSKKREVSSKDKVQAVADSSQDAREAAQTNLDISTKKVLIDNEMTRKRSKTNKTRRNNESITGHEAVENDVDVKSYTGNKRSRKNKDSMNAVKNRKMEIIQSENAVVSNRVTRSRMRRVDV